MYIKTLLLNSNRMQNEDVNLQLSIQKNRTNHMQRLKLIRFHVHKTDGYNNSFFTDYISVIYSFETWTFCILLLKSRH